ncbi:MAG TPA: SpoIIE family protein phosphatase [Firmicutes bacterium]|nr:SpoIIE family protein phosphatase [Bacillota bacterium]
MGLKVEVAVAQLNKHNEELCGDYVETVENSGTIVVLSDGLGSGVKAHILSSLTAKMTAAMLKGGIELAEVLDAIAKTLPVCEVRHLAYSTFTILRVADDNSAYLAEYDNPPAFIGRGGELMKVERKKRLYGGREIRESFFHIQDGDWIVLVSDGVVHAGIGGVWNLGWGWERIADYLKRVAPYEEDAFCLARELKDTVERLYAGHPGDDATIVAIKARVPRVLTVLVGPPVNRKDDPVVVRKLMEGPGKKAVCGGTTSIMVARELGKSVEVNLASLHSSSPPTGRIEGIDLVAEGILTLTKAMENLQGGRPSRRDFKYRSDGPGRLTDMLLEADEIHFLVGRAINPAHQSPDLPISLALKQKVVEDLCRLLTSYGKKVTVQFF